MVLTVGESTFHIAVESVNTLTDTMVTISGRLLTGSVLMDWGIIATSSKVEVFNIGATIKLPSSPEIFKSIKEQLREELERRAKGE